MPTRKQRDPRTLSSPAEGIDAPICQDTRSGGVADVLTIAEVCHDALIDLASEKAFETPDDVPFGPAICPTSDDIVDCRLVIAHTDHDGSMEGGEGVFLQLRADAVATWLRQPAVKQRLEGLATGHQRWKDDRKTTRLFPGGPYVLLHTLSHLLIQSLAMRCGYPASSIRERIYADTSTERFGLLLYTGSPDAEGTLGGLVQEARHIEEHLLLAMRMGGLCSNDPICAHHTPGTSLEKRWLHGAACHGCALVAETSCEMRNDYLDRALVVPVVGVTGAAFFGAVV